MRDKKKLQSPHIPYGWLILIAVAIFILAAAVLLYSLKIDEVEVTGNFYTTKEDVTAAVFTEENDYRLYRVIWKSVFGISGIPGFYEESVSLTGLHSARVTVREKEAVAYLESDKNMIYIDDAGTVLAVNFQNVDDLPNFRGVTVKGYQVLSTVQVDDFAALQGQLRVKKEYEKVNLNPDRILFAENVYYADFDKVRVALGTLEYLPVKAAKTGVLSDYDKGLRGILHLENVTDQTGEEKIIFEVVDVWTG